MKQAWALTAMLFAFPAFAQAPVTPAPATVTPVTKPAMYAPARSNAPLLPVPKLLPAPPAERGGRAVESPPAFPGRVPPLPPARACAKGDIEGLWKLLQVYEEPSGAETNAFYARPSQYLRFNPDTTYGQFVSNQDIGMSDDMLDRGMRQQGNGTQQYVLQQGGMIYYYSNSIATKSEACFIVTNPREYFPQGQMLLMPPSTQSPTRWVKVYTKIWGR